MKPFTLLDGLVCPLDRANVDTDAIIPKQFLKSIKRSGFGPYLFDEWRYEDVGQPGMDCSKRPLKKDFVLNQPRYQGAQILLTRDNFGCGSSREHAVWAIQGAGVGAVIAQSFARIFYRNCINCGFYPIELPDALKKIADGDELDIDYTAGVIRNKTQNTTLSFTPLPDFALAIVRDGGLLPHITKQTKS